MNAADVVLVGCTKTKRTLAATARDLYDPSDLFARRRHYAETSGLPWGILSAYHGAIAPDVLIAPYDYTIAQRLRPDNDPRGWAIASIQSCYRLAGLTPGIDPIVIEIHAGIDYVRALALALPAFSKPIELRHPVAGMMIGEQKAHYTRPTIELPLGQLSLAL